MKVRITITDGGKTASTNGDFSSLIGAVEFAGRYMGMTPRRHARVTAVTIESVEPKRVRASRAKKPVVQ